MRRFPLHARAAGGACMRGWKAGFLHLHAKATAIAPMTITVAIVRRRIENSSGAKPNSALLIVLPNVTLLLENTEYARGLLSKCIS